MSVEVLRRHLKEDHLERPSSTNYELICNILHTSYEDIHNMLHRILFFPKPKHYHPCKEMEANRANRANQ